MVMQHWLLNNYLLYQLFSLHLTSLYQISLYSSPGFTLSLDLVTASLYSIATFFYIELYYTSPITYHHLVVPHILLPNHIHVHLVTLYYFMWLNFMLFNDHTNVLFHFIKVLYYLLHTWSYWDQFPATILGIWLVY